MTTDDLVAQRARDLEYARNLALLNAGLRTHPDLTDIVPSQLRCAACRLVQEFAGVEQSLFLRLRNASFATTLTLCGDPDTASMERRWAEEIATDRPIANVTQASEVAIAP